MATSSIILDIRANTNRALADFKRFSSQLDNKFLISGLKLDVVRSALGQINREFQKAIGEQGLTAGQSLRAAQNQASLLLQTFKGFGDEASMSITESFSSTFNQIAVTAGGTFDDVKKSLAATPWISADLPKEIREKLGAGVLDFQRDARRAGLGEDFAGMARQFLMGQVNAGDLVKSGDPLKSEIGMRLQQAGGGPSTIVDAAQRSRVLLDVLSDPKFRDQIAKAAKGAAGFRIILEDLSSTLFNPEKGIFGAVRKVTMAVGDTTTILDETQKLIESIFGKQGTFVLFFEQIKKIFGLEDPLKTVISGIRWLTKQFNRLNTFLQSPEVQKIVEVLRTVFTNVQTFVTKLYDSVTTNLEDPNSTVNQIGQSVKDFFTNIYTSVTNGDWDPANIKTSIRGIGAQIRGFIESVGKSIREADVKKQGTFFLEIFKTVIGEVAQTLGTAIKEAILVVFSGKGLAVVGGALKVLYEGLSKFFAGLFGGSGPLGAIFGGAAMAGLGILLARRIRGAFDSVLRPIQALRTGGGGALGVINRLFGGGGGRGVGDPGGGMGFQGQVIARMDAIIRILAGGGATDLDYGGPSSPVDGGPRRRRSRGGGPDLDAPTRGFRGTTGKRARIGRFGSGIAEFGRNIYTDVTSSGYDSSGYPIDGDDFDLPEAPSDARGRSTRERFNSRYGSGGRRAQIGRGLKRFGKGALIAGGITAATLGISSLLGGGAAQASEIDPATGLPIQTPEQQSKQNQMAGVGNVLGGGLEGAMTGAAIGSIIPGIGTATGAVIGAVIGGVIPLLDEGTRKGVKDFTDGVGKSLQGAGSNIGKAFQSAGDSISKAASNGIQWIKDGFGSISKWFGNIDWKTVLINALVPGGSMTIEGLKGIAEFASKLNIFDGIKAGIDSIAAPVKSIWDNISSWKPPWAREVGGPVIKGTSYIVGERGPEIFTPGASGSVSTNRELTAMRSGGGSASSVSANFNVTITVNGNMGAGNVEELRGPVMAIIKQAWEEASTGIATRGSVV